MATDETRHDTDPYQYASARAAGSQETTQNEDSLDYHSMAADRYMTQPSTVAQPGRHGDYMSQHMGQHGDFVNVGKGERIASLLGGAALAAYGARKRSAGALALAAAGGALLYRGASGHCPLNSALGRNTARH